MRSLKFFLTLMPQNVYLLLKLELLKHQFNKLSISLDATVEALLQTFGQTLKSSITELSMLSMFLLTGIIFFSTIMYYLEKDEPHSDFYSIPAACWWCVWVHNFICALSFMFYKRSVAEWLTNIFTQTFLTYSRKISALLEMFVVLSSLLAVKLNPLATKYQ